VDSEFKELSARAQDALDRTDLEGAVLYWRSALDWAGERAGEVRKALKEAEERIAAEAPDDNIARSEPRSAPDAGGDVPGALKQVHGGQQNQGRRDRPRPT